MKKLSLTILFLFSISLLGCEKLNEEKAKTAIRNYLNENLDDMATYEPVKYGILDTLYIFNGYIVQINNINNPFHFVHAESAQRNNQLGFLNDETGLVEPYDSLRHKLFLLKDKIVLYNNVGNRFYSVGFKSKVKMPKNRDSNLPIIKSENMVIIFSQLDPNQYEMFHSYRLKNEKGVKFITKKFFKLDNKFVVMDEGDNSFKFNPMAYVSYYDETIAVDTAAADTAAAQ